MVTNRLSDFPFARLRQEMDRVFDGLWDASTFTGRAFPAMNVWEQDDALYVEAELPGLTTDDIDISIVGPELTIRGERKSAAPEGATYQRRERGTGEFVRVVRLPVEIDAEKVDARLENGVLTLTLPKAEAARPRKIAIQAQA